MFTLATIFTLLAGPSLAVQTVVDLGYSKYQGQVQANGISTWFGMRYAAPPLGALRFAAPQDPPTTSGTQDAISTKRTACIGVGDNVNTQDAEDCLYVHVWAPTAATTTSKLPVHVYIQGGGFNDNGDGNRNATGLMRAAQNNIVVVQFNYRVGVYGFLASSEIYNSNTAATNAGILDQRKLLQWVQKNIAQFGGNPGHVFLDGASAGAGSVAIHLTAYGGRNDNLFHAIASQAPSLPPLLTISEAQFQYDRLVVATKCSGTPSTLDCLRRQNVTYFQQQAKTVPTAFPGTNQAPIYFWGPSIDNRIIANYTYGELDAKHFVRVPAIFGSTSNEGNSFVNAGLRPQQTQKNADDFIKAQFPKITDSDINNLHTVFSGPGSDGTYTQYAADMLGRFKYICPALSFARGFVYADYPNTQPANAKTWVYRWDVGAATHVAEMGDIFATDGHSTQAGTDIQNYWASMIRSYDPNTYMPPGRPRWAAYGTGGSGNYGTRVLFQNSNTGMETVSSVTQGQCNVIWQIGRSVRQ
ncbi:vacuolar triacylglycerol lipase [Pseudovirgaria hyperparasitica]|uniref:Carboxylic ester hydrolase n=1 Tax=Pseudovirgaria hyperparasitica TaxID=470096 RepID=A0A6A6WK15_9PEZI|nr:vacuolar triacylglycerol lipase [Pseudovirgaria hyperparasitica]KAF2762517.1 vacuolar triacylglycerol lipase [Pseudovirgaria hyperparasitica]